MKDLTLRKSSDSSLIGTLRCEMFSNAPASNVEVVEIKDATNKRVDQLLIGGNFPLLRLKYNFVDIINACNAASVKIVSTDSNGSNSANIN